MSVQEEFKANRYVHLEGFLDEQNCSQLATLLREEASKRGWNDKTCPKSVSVSASQTFDKLLVDLLPHFERASGLKLLPTYAYARVYAPGEVLHVHLDRPSCEISATLTLAFEGDEVWPIYMGIATEEKTDFVREQQDGAPCYLKNVSVVSMKVGDAVMYRGCEVAHGRDEYTQGKWQAQVFLHYVDANGPHAEWIYDKRGGLNIPTEDIVSEDNDLVFWAYDDVLTEKDCDALVKLYSAAESEEAGIGAVAGNVVKEIRNVRRRVLPVHKGIGARLAAVGLDANAQRWKFAIDRANQSEFLSYPAGGGRYKGHLDTFLSKDPKNLAECRKVTVLAFLNDDFTGGKFWLQTGAKKFYPPQKKGTVLVFPSFLLHGVDDVEEGQRYTCVCWLVGPWFK